MSLRSSPRGSLSTRWGASQSIEVETVFGVDGVGFVEWSEGETASSEMEWLRSLRAKGEAVTDARPGCRSTRRSETGGGGIGSIRDAFEDEDALIEEAADFSCGRRSDRGGFCMQVAPEEKTRSHEARVLDETATVHGSCLLDHGTCRFALSVRFRHC